MNGIVSGNQKWFSPSTAKVTWFAFQCPAAASSAFRLDLPSWIERCLVAERVVECGRVVRRHVERCRQTNTELRHVDRDGGLAR